MIQLTFWIVTAWLPARRNGRARKGCPASTYASITEAVILCAPIPGDHTTFAGGAALVAISGLRAQPAFWSCYRPDGCGGCNSRSGFYQRFLYGDAGHRQPWRIWLFPNSGGIGSSDSFRARISCRQHELAHRNKSPANNATASDRSRTGYGHRQSYGRTGG